MMIGDGDDHQQQPGSPPRSLPPLPPPGEDLLARFHYLKSTINFTCTYKCQMDAPSVDRQTDR